MSSSFLSPPPAPPASARSPQLSHVQPSPAPPAVARYQGTLRLLTINDVYSHAPVDGCGGWAQLSSMLQQHRNSNSLFTLNGDCLGGSALAEFHKGANVVEVLNALGTDLAVLGNHEYDFGREELKRRMAESNFTWMGSNIREKETENSSETRLFDGVQNLHQIHIQLPRIDPPPASVSNNGSSDSNGPNSSIAPDSFPATASASIGVFGLCTAKTPALSWPGPLVQFDDVQETAARCIAQLKGEQPIAEGEISFTQLPRADDASAAGNAGSSASAMAASASPCFTPSDVLFALTHLSSAEDRALAQRFPSLSLLLGGHDHDALACMEGSTLVFKAGQNAWWLGVVDLKLEVRLWSKSDGSFQRTVSVYPSWRMEAVRDVQPDPLIQRMVDGWVAKMEAAQAADEDPDEVLALVVEPASLPRGVEQLTEKMREHVLETKTAVVRRGPSAFASLVADAMAAHYADDGCDGAFINGGFIRGDKSYGVGHSLTVRDIRYELPFPKVCVLLRVSGRGIMQALDEMLVAHPVAAGLYPHASSEWDVEFESLPTGQRGKLRRVLHRGEEVKPDRMYKVAVTTFMASGGDGVRGWVDHGTIISNDQNKVADLVIKLLRKRGTIAPDMRERVHNQQ